MGRVAPVNAAAVLFPSSDPSVIEYVDYIDPDAAWNAFHSTHPLDSFSYRVRRGLVPGADRCVHDGDDGLRCAVLNGGITLYLGSSLGFGGHWSSAYS